MNAYGVADELHQPEVRVELGEVTITALIEDSVDHPSHYGGADNPLEVINIIEHYELDFHDGNTVKYILRAGKKDELLTDLKKARWYLNRKIANLEASND